MICDELRCTTKFFVNGLADVTVSSAGGSAEAVFVPPPTF